MARIQRLSTLGLACLVFAPLAAQAAQPDDILTRIPDDAQIAVVIKSLSALQTQINDYATPMRHPLPKDLLTTLLENLGISNGFNVNGAAALVSVRMPPQAKPLSGPDNWVVLLPTSDSAALLETLHPAAPESGISTVTLPNLSAIGYAAKVGTYVAFAQQREVLAAFVSHQGAMSGLDPRIVQAIQDNDIAMYINVNECREALVAILDPSAKRLKAIATAAGVPEPTAGAALALLRTGATEYAGDTGSAVVAATLKEDGLVISAQSLFNSGTFMAKLAAAQTAAGPSDLTGLPEGDDLAAGTATWDAQLWSDLTGKILAQFLGATGAPANSADQKHVDLARRIAALSLGAKFVVLTAIDKLPRTWAPVVVDTDDPVTLEALIADAVKEFNGYGNANFTVFTSVERTAALFQNVRLTKYTIGMHRAPAPHPVTAPINDAIAAMLNAQGPDGLVFYTCTTNKMLLATVGADPKMCQRAIVALQTNNSQLQGKEEHTELKPELPGTHFARLVLSPDFLNQLLQAQTHPTLAAPGSQDIGPGSLPVRVNCTSTQDSIGCQIFVSKDLLIDLGQQIIPLLPTRYR